MVISMENNKFKPINGYEFNAWVGINQTKKMMISNTTRAQSMANTVRCLAAEYIREQNAYRILQSEFVCTMKVTLDLHYESITGKDEGIWVSNPCKYINSLSAINKICGLVADRYITIGSFLRENIWNIINYYYECDSEIHFALLNNGLICIMEGSSSFTRYLSRRNNGKIQIVITYMKHATNINDPSMESYDKFLVSENNFERLTRLCSSFRQFQELGVGHWFINKYNNSYIYDSPCNDNNYARTLIDLSNIQNYCDDGSMVCVCRRALIDSGTL